MHNGDIVTVIVNGNAYTGTLTGGAFSIAVPGSEFVADPDTTVDASITATDAAGNTTTATDTRTYILDVNDQPTIAPIPDQTIDEDETVTATIAEVQAILDALIDDVDGDTVTATLTLDYPAGGHSAADPRGQRQCPFSYTPPPNFHGDVKVTITADDGQGRPNSTATETFTLTVESVNDQPTIGAIDDQMIDEDETVTATVGKVQAILDALTDDVDGDTVTVTLTLDYPAGSGIPQQTIVIDPNAPFSFTPPPNFHGDVEVTATADDGQGKPNSTATESFTLTVTPVNDSPTVGAIDDQTIDEDETVTATIGEVQAILDSLVDDVDGDTVTVTLTLIYPVGHGFRRRPSRSIPTPRSATRRRRTSMARSR